MGGWGALHLAQGDPDGRRSLPGGLFLSRLCFPKSAGAAAVDDDEEEAVFFRQLLTMILCLSVSRCVLYADAVCVVVCLCVRSCDGQVSAEAAAIFGVVCQGRRCSPAHREQVQAA